MVGASLMSLQTMEQLGGVTHTHMHTHLRVQMTIHIHTHTRHTVGVNRGFQTVIEQRRHLQESVRSNIRAEKRSSWKSVKHAQVNY